MSHCDCNGKKMTTFKVVAIEFKENKYKSGEQEVNHNLSCGFEITKDFQTDSGVVIVMSKWEDEKEEDEKEEDKKETQTKRDYYGREVAETKPKKEVDHK